MSPRTYILSTTPGKPPIEVLLHVTAYMTPYSDPPRLMVEALTKNEDHPLGPVYTVLSINLPNMPAPPARQFYFRTWSENKGLMEELVAQGAVRVVEPAGVPVNQGGSKAFLCELADAEVQLDVDSAEERKRAADDTERFLSNTYVQHLGM